MAALQRRPFYMTVFLAATNRSQLALPEGRSLWEGYWGFQSGWKAETRGCGKRQGCSGSQRTSPADQSSSFP